MMWKHIEDTEPEARKNHKCYLCARPITKGTKYLRRYGICEGEKVVTKMHLECEKITKLWDEDDWEFFDPFEFRENLRINNE